MTTARKKWTILDTVQVAEAVLANEGNAFTGEQFDELAEQVNCSRGAAETVVWRIQTVLGFSDASPAQGISALDRAVAQLYLGHDPRLKDAATA